MRDDRGVAPVAPPEWDPRDRARIAAAPAAAHGDAHHEYEQGRRAQLHRRYPWRDRRRAERTERVGSRSAAARHRMTALPGAARLSGIGAP
jgi:hypothetical protein